MFTFVILEMLFAFFYSILLPTTVVHRGSNSSKLKLLLAQIKNDGGIFFMKGTLLTVLHVLNELVKTSYVFVRVRQSVFV